MRRGCCQITGTHADHSWAWQGQVVAMHGGAGDHDHRTIALLPHADHPVPQLRTVPTWRGARRTGRPEQEQPGQQQHSGHADEHQVVGKVVGRPGPDLVEPEQLVLDGAVVQVEAAGPNQDPRRLPAAAGQVRCAIAGPTAPARCPAWRWSRDGRCRRRSVRRPGCPGHRSGASAAAGAGRSRPGCRPSRCRPAPPAPAATGRVSRWPRHLHRRIDQVATRSWSRNRPVSSTPLSLAGGSPIERARSNPSPPCPCR